jgi:hypothetical protein
MSIWEVYGGGAGREILTPSIDRIGAERMTFFSSTVTKLYL